MRVVKHNNASSWARAMAQWAELGRRPRRTLTRKHPSWNAVEAIIQAATPKLEFEAKRLRKLIDKSNKMLSPLSDPLCTDFGVHGFLSQQSEMAYSAWLAWVITQLGSPKLVLQLFGINGMNLTFQSWRNPHVKTEYPIPYGYVGRSGRLDIKVHYPGHAVIIIEVKLTEPFGTKKQKGYLKWLQEQPEPKANKKAILLALESEEDVVEGFDVQRWEDLCARLRRMVLKHEVESPSVAAAMILGFVGAVEQKLLGFSFELIKCTLEKKNSSLTSSISDYLSECVGGVNND